MDFHSLQSKISFLELKLRYSVKTLPFSLKIFFLGLLFVFLISGLAILHQLDKKLSVEVPDEGGTLEEGIVGTPRFVNPVLTISDADRDIAILVYSGLMRANNNILEPDLAENYQISESGLCYTFTLKSDLRWSDGEPLTSDDVIFTVKQIQNPITKSPKRGGWEGVSTEKIDEKKLQFCLQKPYAPFLENTTIGILPQHIWQDILPEQMPLSTFNINPIGSGPYKIHKITRSSSGIITSYTLVPNENFVPQKPYLKKITLKFYPSEKKLIEAYNNGEINSLNAISSQDILKIKKETDILKTYLLPRIFAVFFNQNNAALFADKQVRSALNLGIDKDAIVKEILRDFGTALEGPVPPGSLGYIEIKKEYENFDQQLEEAEKILARAGWKINEERILEKKSKKETLKMEFSLSTSNVPELVQTANLLKKMWENLGARVNLKIYEIGDLEQNIIRPRNYDALLFGEIIGREPDAFAFWHSSQRNDPGLNVALYANITVDKLLEDARTIFDLKKREEKYRQFQIELTKDTPAVFLYSPYFTYLIPQSLRGVQQKSITVPSERFSQIYNWYLKTKKVWKIFLDS